MPSRWRPTPRPPTTGASKATPRAVRLGVARPLLVTLLAAWIGSCGGAAPPVVDARAEWRARRASERVTGPDGAPGEGFSHRQTLEIEDDDEGPARVATAGAGGGGSGSAGKDDGLTGGRVKELDVPPAGAAASDPDRRYPIVLSPPSTVGEKSHERTEATVVTETSLRLDGREVRRSQEDRTVRIAGVATVREVDSEGVVLVYEIEVESATVESGGVKRALASRGDVVEVRRKGPAPRISVNGQAPSPEDLQAFELPLTTSDPGASNDAVLGSRQPRSVGESWPVDSAKAAEDFSRQGKMQVSASAVSGQSTLAATRSCGKSQTCLLIRSELDIGPFDIVGLPPGASMRHSECAVRIEALQPLTPRAAESVGRMDMRLRTLVGMAQGTHDVEIETVMVNRQVGWSTPR